MKILRLRRKSKIDLDEAKAALCESKQQFKQTKERGEEVEEVVTQLRELRRQNHFAERLRPTMGGPS